MVNGYRGQNSSVIMSFIDAPRAFDRINHFKLFVKLRDRGVPGSIVRILAYWYANKTMRVKWEIALLFLSGSLMVLGKAEFPRLYFQSILITVILIACWVIIL